MLHLRVYRGNVFISNIETEWKYDPGEIAKSGTDEEDDRNRHQV
jgi:hypothetical protein